MKKKLLLLLTFLLMLALLAGCAGKEPVLNGTYVGNLSLAEVQYSFAEDGNVAVKMFVGGYEVMQLAGIYAIDEEAGSITFTLPESTENMGNFSFTTPSLSGTFAFAAGENYIDIDGVRYNKSAQ